MALVDSNVLIDIFARDPDWEPWSVAALQSRSSLSDLIINEIVYAEVSARYGSRAVVDVAIAELGIRFHRAPLDALHKAGQTFNAYRQRGGTRDSLLPDFFIGAHAATVGIPIVTRETRRYRAYFPDVKLIAP